MWCTVQANLTWACVKKDRSNHTTPACALHLLTPSLDSYLEVFAPKTWLNVCPDVFMGGAGYCAEYCTSRYSLSLGTLGSSNAYFLVTRCGRRRKMEERKEDGKERERWK